jgi:hypothetical protein
MVKNITPTSGQKDASLTAGGNTLLLTIDIVACIELLNAENDWIQFLNPA